MTALQQLFAQLVKTIAASANAIFDKSFETKSFDGRPWKTRKRNRRGSLLVDSGALRRSLKYTINGNTITWTSNLPYAKIHNDGGYIKITRGISKGAENHRRLHAQTHRRYCTAGEAAILTVRTGLLSGLGAGGVSYDVWYVRL